MCNFKRRPATETTICPNCHREFNVRGYGRHKNACRPPQTRGPALSLDADDYLHLPTNNGASFFHTRSTGNPTPNHTDDQIQIPDYPYDGIDGGPAGGSREEPGGESGSGEWYVLGSWTSELITLI